MPLAVRAVLAVVLMVLFYAFAAAAVAALTWIGVELFGVLGDVRGRGVILLAVLAIACLAAAGIIAWSVLPRLDRFEPPGPEATAGEHPELFVEIRRIAERTGQHEPAHVYLVSDVNAFVAQRGGIMGIGSRRIMGIGLPLLRALQVDELRAVLAHEMGHFYGGDTKLGPWIYKTRGALVRAVANLARARASSRESQTAALVFAVIHAPFRWFLMGYLRVSQAISRAQEYSADAVAVRAEGRRAVIDGLTKTHAAAVAHQLYLREEVVPLLQYDALPDVGDGFSRFLASELMAKLHDKIVQHELDEARQDRYDSHPPLRERIAAARRVDGPDLPPDPRPAIMLLRDPEVIEAAELARRVDKKLERIRWVDTPRLWTKLWRERASGTRRLLRGVQVDGFPTDLKELYRRATEAHGRALKDADDDVRHWWHDIVGTALVVMLLDEGFAAATDVGEPVRLTRGDITVEPFAEVGRCISGELSPAAWSARCAELGLAGRAFVSGDRT